MSLFKKAIVSRQIDIEIGGSSLAPYKDGDLIIAVMDRGWVFVGLVTKLDGGEVRLDESYNVHRWGTTKGLGEIALNGPTSETVLNPAGTVYGKPILVFSTDIDKWG
jgi:hypothetical protein